LIVYHGTNFDFDTYDINESDDRLSIFTTDVKSIADSYMNDIRDYITPPDMIYDESEVSHNVLD